ncbi:hypothetical protein [Devosia sp. A449]
MLPPDRLRASSVQRPAAALVFRGIIDRKPPDQDLHPEAGGAVSGHPRIRAFDMDAIQFQGAAFGAAGFQVDAAEGSHITDRQGAEIVRVIGQPQGNLGFIRHQAQIGNLVIGAKQQSREPFPEVQLRIGTHATQAGSRGKLQAGQVGDPPFDLDMSRLLLHGFLK